MQRAYCHHCFACHSFFCMCTRVSFWKMYVLLCHHGCGSEFAFDHCSYFFSLFTTHSKGKVVNRLACEKALHLGGRRERSRESRTRKLGDACARSWVAPLARAFSHGLPSRACSQAVNRRDFRRSLGSSPRRV